MAAGEAQLTDLPGGVVTRPGADQDGLTRPARTRPAIEALEDVATPALVAVGDRDVPGFREMSAALARRIPGAEYRVVAGAGHMVNMEQPAAVNELLTWFLAGLPAPATEGLSEPTEELTEQGDEQWSR